MTFLPIVERELRVTCRKPGTYWGRTVSATVGLGVAVWVYLMSIHEPAPSQAFALFATLSGAMMLLGGFAGMGITADVLSSEKRDGTLGLLFLTPLRGYDVVLGKLCAGSVAAFYGLLTMTPLLALPMLMGGLSVGEFVRMSLLLLNTMLLSLTAGMAVSSISRDERRARAGTLVLLLTFAAGFPLAGAIVENELHARGVGQWLLIFSPGYAFAGAWDATRPMPVVAFWPSMAAIHVSAWLLLGVACYFTPRTWQDKAARRGGGWRRLLRGSPSKVRPQSDAFRQHTLDENAFLWLSTRPVHRPLLVWGVLLAISAIWVGFGLRHPTDMFSLPMFVVMGLTWNSVIKVWVSSEVTRQIAVDRRSGAIELLLSTPLTVSDIVRGQWLSLRRLFGWPVVAVVLAEILFMFLGLLELRRNQDGRLFWMVAWFCIIGMLFIDIVALFVVGLWQAVAARAPTKAAGVTAFRILACPWLAYLGLMAVWVVAMELRLMPRISRPGWGFWLGSWLLISLGMNLAFGIPSWKAVNERFREMAAHRQPAGAWGARLGRAFGRLMLAAKKS